MHGASICEYILNIIKAHACEFSLQICFATVRVRIPNPCCMIQELTNVFCKFVVDHVLNPCLHALKFANVFWNCRSACILIFQTI